MARSAVANQDSAPSGDDGFPNRRRPARRAAPLARDDGFRGSPYCAVERGVGVRRVTTIASRSSSSGIRGAMSSFQKSD